MRVRSVLRRSGVQDAFYQSGQKVVRWLVCWSVLDLDSIYALDQNAVRCVGLVLGRCSRVCWYVSFGGVRYAGWKVVRCAELSFALHLAALVAAIVASHT